MCLLISSCGKGNGRTLSRRMIKKKKSKSKSKQEGIQRGNKNMRKARPLSQTMKNLCRSRSKRNRQVRESLPRELSPPNRLQNRNRPKSRENDHLKKRFPNDQYQRRAVSPISLACRKLESAPNSCVRKRRRIASSTSKPLSSSRTISNERTLSAAQISFYCRLQYSSPNCFKSRLIERTRRSCCQCWTTWRRTRTIITRRTFTATGA